VHVDALLGFQYSLPTVEIIVVKPYIRAKIAPDIPPRAAAPFAKFLLVGWMRSEMTTEMLRGAGGEGGRRPGDSDASGHAASPRRRNLEHGPQVWAGPQRSLGGNLSASPRSAQAGRCGAVSPGRTAFTAAFTRKMDRFRKHFRVPSEG